jgi:hypothetical protein
MATNKLLLKGKEVWFIFNHSSPGNDFLRGYIDARSQLRAIFDQNKITLVDKDDEGKEDIARQLAERAINSPQVIAVVGHLESSVMRAVADTYLRSDMPVMMPVPTSPGLIMQSNNSPRKNFIRMPPNDVRQAHLASSFLISGNVKRIMIVQDLDNFIYSQSLGKLLTQEIRKYKASHADGPTIVPGISIGGDSPRQLPVDAIEASDPDAIYFPGTTSNAITFLDGLLSYARFVNAGRPIPLILLTDGVLSADFLKQVSVLPPKLYLTFQLPDKYPNSNGASTSNYCVSSYKFSFCPYGVDAVFLIKKTIADLTTDTRSIKAKFYENVTREDILDYFNRDLKTAHQSMLGEFGRYEFDKEGENGGFGFKLLEPVRERERERPAARYWKVFPFDEE